MKTERAAKMTSKILTIVGIVVILFASFINGLLVEHNVGGLAREGMRLLILAGIVIFVFGLIRSKKAKKS